jgi:hypothetical protein
MENKSKTIDSRTSPFGLLIIGKDFKRACEIISEKCPDKHSSLPNTDLYKVRLYLIGHAFELLFKSILLQCGVALAVLRSKKFGHDIIALENKIEEFALFPLSETEKALLSLLNEYYKAKDFEYHVRGAKQYPYLSELIHLGDRLFAAGEKWLRGQSVKKAIIKL